MTRAQPIPASVVKALRLALADERDARATYTAILARFGPIRPFVNIVAAEGRHEAALLALYQRYGVPVPDDTAQAPPFCGSLDLASLCAIAVRAEQENVRLYDEELLPAVSAHADIRAVMTRLRDASHDRHLPAFKRCAESGGVSNCAQPNNHGDTEHGIQNQGGGCSRLRRGAHAGGLCDH